MDRLKGRVVRALGGVTGFDALPRGDRPEV
jgi:hypothetical protein